MSSKRRVNHSKLKHFGKKGFIRIFLPVIMLISGFCQSPEYHKPTVEPLFPGVGWYVGVAVGFRVLVGISNIFLHNLFSSPFQSESPEPPARNIPLSGWIAGKSRDFVSPELDYTVELDTWFFQLGSLSLSSYPMLTK